jgi:hypothetical protein
VPTCRQDGEARAVECGSDAARDRPGDEVLVTMEHERVYALVGRIWEQVEGVGDEPWADNGNGCAWPSPSPP